MSHLETTGERRNVYASEHTKDTLSGKAKIAKSLHEYGYDVSVRMRLRWKKAKV